MEGVLLLGGGCSAASLGVKILPLINERVT